MTFRRPRTINLALQGGGAHGAYTWGVLDRLLEDERFRIGWISGTSAGAVNAAAVASGLATGGRTRARETLAQVWLDVARAGLPDFVRLNPLLNSLSRSATMAQFASLFSPYDITLQSSDPFRRLIEGHIDFAAIRSQGPIELIIPATNVRTGQARFFSKREISADVILASACLPAIHRAVEIDGESYWDGGFSANPDLVTLARRSPHRDTLIVQLHPLRRPDVPTSAHAILDHVYQMTFLSPAVRDVEAILDMRLALGGPRRFRLRTSRGARMADHRFHLIDATPRTADLDWSSKVNPDFALFRALFAAGRADTQNWLATSAKHVGRRETIDLRAHFLDRGFASPAITSKLTEPEAQPAPTKKPWRTRLGFDRAAL